MKVLQILPSLEVGGVERGVIDVARGLKKRGWECIVISSGGQLVGELQKMGVTHYNLPVHKKSLFSLGLVSKISEIIEREHVDVVHARSRVPGWLAWLAARKTGRPFVTTCHGYYSAHLLSRIMGWGKRVIVISRIVGRHMVDHFGVSPDRIRLVHRGVDLAQFKNVQRPARDAKKPFRVINVGRLSPIKGHIEFLKAVHLLRREVPNLEVWIVGSEGKGKHKYTDLIHETIRQLNLEAIIKMPGTRRDIPELLAQSDALVLSTLVPEAFGRVVIEAGAVGTPAVSTKVGGVLDIIDDGENGLLVPPGDSEAMARALLYLYHHPEAAEQYAAKLREKVEKNFSLDQMIDKTIEVYKEAVAEKRILVIKLGAMGDLILAVPSLRMLRERYPQAWISVLVDRKWAGLLSACPYIQEVICVDRKQMGHLPYLLKTAKRLRREAFDFSVDLQNSKWTHLLAWLAGIPARFGFARGFAGRFLTHPDNTYAQPDSPVRHQYRVLSKAGVRKLDETLELWSDPSSEARAEEWLVKNGKRKIGLVIGSSPRWETKRWPLASFQALAERLIQKHKSEIVLIGSPDDAKLIEGQDFWKQNEIINLLGKTSLSELVAVVKRLDVLVTGDTAPLHVAAASQTRLVALFGPTDSKRHMPPAAHAAVFKKNLPCQPCYQGTCRNEEKLACMTHIQVEDVLQAVLKQVTGKEAEKQPVTQN